MVALPPGTILQLMYLGERLGAIPRGHFIEVGPGGGEITKQLLMAGWSGTAYDLSEETVERLKQRFSPEIISGQLTVVQGDYLNSPPLRQKEERADAIISCMVMEHLDNEMERKFMEFSATHLKSEGRMIGLVPASPRHWGIEDDVAGHYRRYNRDSLLSLLHATGWKLCHVAGLTYPVSNLLLPLSNYLVRRDEVSKLALTSLERTKHSGRRHVPFKTYFPSIMKLLLNERTLLPFHWIQKLFSNSDRALVIYFEAAYKTR